MVKTLLVEINIGFTFNRKLLWLLLMGPYFSNQVVAKPLSYIVNQLVVSQVLLISKVIHVLTPLGTAACILWTLIIDKNQQLPWKLQSILTGTMQVCGHECSSLWWLFDIPMHCGTVKLQLDSKIHKIKQNRDLVGR